MKQPTSESTRIWKTFLCFTLFFLAAALPCLAAEDPAKFPSKPINMIINFNPGSSTDLTSRKLADLAGKILGKTIVPENRPGGAGVIGANDVAKAAPDGYTIGGGTSSATVVSPHFQKVPYNTKEDFSWIMLHTEQTQPFAVLSSARWKNFKEFVEEARKNPDKLKAGTAGVGGAPHIIIEQVFAQEKVKITHVPTSGGSEVVSLTLGGHVDAAMAMALCPHVKSKKLRAIAIGSETRMEVAPDVPTFEEMGYKVEAPVQWVGVFAPKGIPPAIFKKLVDAFKKAAEDPSFKELLNTLVLAPMYKDPESARQLINRDFDIMARLAKTFKVD